MPPFAKSLWLLLMLLAAVYVTALVTSIVVCVLVQRCIDCTGLYRDKYHSDQIKRHLARFVQVGIEPVGFIFCHMND